MSDSYVYVNFMSVKDAQSGFDILCKAAADNNDFLSYNNFKEIVSGNIYACDPAYGWTLEKFKTSQIKPNYHMYVLEIPYPEQY